MKIVENKRELLSDFIRLNEEWISKHFELEDVDRDFTLVTYKRRPFLTSALARKTLKFIIFISLINRSPS